MGLDETREGFLAAILGELLKRCDVQCRAYCNQRSDQRSGHNEPHEEPANEEACCRAFKSPLQIAKPGVAHLEPLKACLRDRIGQSERQNDQRPPEDRLESIVPGRSRLMEADAAKDSPGQPVAARTKDREVTEEGGQHEADQAGQFPELLYAQSEQEYEGVEWNENSDCDQEPDQQLTCSSSVFEGLSEHLSVGPEILTRIGGQPEAVDAESDRQEHGSSNPDPPVFPVKSQELNGTGWQPKAGG